MKTKDDIKRQFKVTQASDVRASELALEADVVVIGSGAGGAVAAYELAASGKKVIVLEAGSYVPSTNFTEELGKSMEDLYQDQGSQSNLEGDLAVLQGACVGGSTVVNAAIAFRTPDHILKLWAEKFGLENLTPETLKPYFEKVEKHLSIHVNEAWEIDAGNQLMAKGAKKLGLHWQPVSRNIKSCALTGFCLSGCASDRKQSMLVTYLPWAVEKGAEVYADTKAQRIIEKDGRITGVEAQVIDPKTKEIVSNITISSKVVVLAAGAIQSPLLLQRSDVANSSGKVGENFACHPSFFITGQYEQSIYGWKGALNGGYIGDFMEHDKGGFLLIPNMVGPLEWSQSFGMGTGVEHLELMKDIKYMYGINTLMHDENHGSVYEKDGVKTIDYTLHPKNIQSVKMALREASKLHFASGAKKVYLPSYTRTEITSVDEIDAAIESISFEPNNLFMTSFHPQGTCQMGADAKTSVVSGTGESHDVKGLFVADASIFPQTTLFHPQQTVYTLASYIADQVIADKSNNFG